MPSADDHVFIICTVGSIRLGDAKAFRLSRLTESGEGKPFPIVIIRMRPSEVVGYVNACPHEGTWLNIGAGEFFTPDRAFLRCGRHGAKFEIGTGQCVGGPCEGKALQSIKLAVIDGDVCLIGIALVEDDGIPDPFVELDDTVEVMIHPD